MTRGGFASFSVPAIKSMAGTARGGLLTMVALALPCDIEPLDSNSTNLGIVCLNFGHSKLMVVNVYNSRYEKNAISVLEELHGVLTCLRAEDRDDVPLVILGDFNIYPCTL